MFVYKVSTLYELILADYDYILPYNKVLPEAVCYCLQRYNFKYLYHKYYTKRVFIIEKV